MLIRVAAGDAPDLCARCGRPADRLTFAVGNRTLCRRCARQSAR
jgi:hypothetical protein